MLVVDLKTSNMADKLTWICGLLIIGFVSSLAEEAEDLSGNDSVEDEKLVIDSIVSERENDTISEIFNITATSNETEVIAANETDLDGNLPQTENTTERKIEVSNSTTTPKWFLDAHKQHSLNTRFGVVAVPTILLFHSGKPVLKFNNSITLEDLRMFVKNNTGIEGNFSVEISEQDYIGPLINKPTEETDYYLIFSSLFLLIFGAFMFAKSSYQELLWNRIQAIPWRSFVQWFRRDKQD
ncbi:Thioredoxin domain-containing protein 15 [Stylophora pistillata]|uniref:Thioredoxin domain-containing protein 15 n=1 Tax=Stylophora pistillata TaxID=50429 RepID=A0A2B4RDN9_STYPI|nr:Thioredoxin domain-containing protein 15 [Stylophora pistillata]